MTNREMIQKEIVETHLDLLLASRAYSRARKAMLEAEQAISEANARINVFYYKLSICED